VHGHGNGARAGRRGGCAPHPGLRQVPNKYAPGQLTVRI